MSEGMARETSMAGEAKRVAITGAAGGLGLALAKRFAREGRQIVAIDRDAEALRQMAAAVAADAKVCDIVDEAACLRLAAETGPVDLLINNAGITHFGRFETSAPSVVRHVMDVNFQGAVNMTAAYLPGLIAKQGAIAAIASVAGFAPLYGRTAYAASKHAMFGFFSTLATEVADRGVHVLIACPSFIATQATTRSAGQSSDGIARPGSAGQTAGKPLSPDDVADAIADGLARKRRLLPIGRLARLSYWVSRLAPAFYEKSMLRRMRAEIG
jgi:short-subunit dehydrogenase